MNGLRQAQPERLTQVQAEVHRRLLHAFVARGRIEPWDAEEMLAYKHYGAPACQDLKQPLGLFSLTGLDFGLSPFAILDSLDLVPTLTILGLGNTLLSEALVLSGLSNFAFQGWSNLREVSFSANADFILDNIAASSVPEPGSLALMGVALAGFLLARRRPRQG